MWGGWKARSLPLRDFFSAEIGGELPQLDFPQHPPREGSPRPRLVIVSLGEKPRAMMQTNRLPIPEYQQKH